MTGPKMSDADHGRTERERAARAEIAEEVNRLKEHAARTTSSCPVATLIAVTNEEVQETLISKVIQGNQPRGVRCLRPGLVLFAFDCPPGVICLISPSFAVIVNLRERRVEQILDPFDPTEVGVTAPLAATAPPMGVAASRHGFAGTFEVAEGATVWSIVRDVMREVFGRDDIEDATLRDLGMDASSRALLRRRISQRIPGLSPPLRDQDFRPTLTYNDVVVSLVIPRLPNPE